MPVTTNLRIKSKWLTSTIAQKKAVRNKFLAARNAEKQTSPPLSPGNQTKQA
jgi:hypothetical protein